MKYSLFVACIICVLLGGSEVTSLLSKTRRSPLSLFGSKTTTTTTTKKPLRATNTLTSSLSKLLGLGAAATTAPTPQTKIKEIIPDLGSIQIQSKLNELRKSESLAAEKLAPLTTEDPHITVSDPYVPTPSPPTSVPNTSRQVLLEPSQADSVIPPASCTEIELIPEPNILPQSVELQRDEKQRVESEQTAGKDSFKENDGVQFSAQDGQDGKAGKEDLNIEQTLKKPEDVEAVSIIPIVTDSASEIIESISNLNLADSSVLEGESKNPVEKHPLPSAPEIIDQIDDATPKEEDEVQSLPLISEGFPSELINKSTDPTIHPTDLEFSDSSTQAVEYPDLQKQDLNLISDEILPLPSSTKPEWPEEIRSTDSLLPEVETVIPSTISTDPLNLPLESGGPDNESPNPAVLENTEITSSVIPVTDVETTQETRSTDSLLPEVETAIPSTISTDPVNFQLESAEPDNESPNPAALENTEITSSVIPVADVEPTQDTRSTDSLLPEEETAIPSTISTDPVNLQLESAVPDNESLNPAALENTEINSPVIPVADVESTQEKVTDAEHNNLPIQEDQSLIQRETDNVSELNTLLTTNNLLPSTDSEDIPVDLTNPVVETENIDILPAIPSETPVVPLPEVTLPPTSAVKYVISTGFNKLSSPIFNTGNIGPQYQTDPVRVTGSPLATSLCTDNSVREFPNLFNYGDEPLIDIHDNEYNLLKIVIF